MEALHRLLQVLVGSAGTSVLVELQNILEVWLGQGWDLRGWFKAIKGGSMRDLPRTCCGQGVLAQDRPLWGQRDGWGAVGRRQGCSRTEMQTPTPTAAGERAEGRAPRAVGTPAAFLSTAPAALHHVPAGGRGGEGRGVHWQAARLQQHLLLAQGREPWCAQLQHPILSTQLEPTCLRLAQSLGWSLLLCSAVHLCCLSP